MKHILFVEDDPDYQFVIKELLDLEGYEVTLADNAAKGLSLFKNSVYDLVISDLKMMSIDGLQFLSLLRKFDATVKVILLTGSTEDRDEIKGLDLDVNDYIKKPVSMDVLLKRIEKVIEDEPMIQIQELMSQSAEIAVNLKQRRVYKNEQLVELTRREYELLVFLLQHKNAVLTREEIIREVWHTNDQLVDLRTVDTHVKKLRSKLHLSNIYSIRGVGYEWVE